MQCNILAIGQKMPPWCIQACQEYTKRLQHLLPTTLTPLAAAERAASRSVAQYKADEGKKILAKIAPSDWVVALEVTGKSWSTETLAEQVQQWRESHQKTCLVIGGPDGLDPAVLQRAQVKWSLSPLTLPHAFVRVLVLEQLYRAMTILSDHPYHRS